MLKIIGILCLIGLGVYFLKNSDKLLGKMGRNLREIKKDIENEFEQARKIYKNRKGE